VHCTLAAPAHGYACTQGQECVVLVICVVHHDLIKQSSFFSNLRTDEKASDA
jgi:hypothetical protein